MAATPFFKGETIMVLRHRAKAVTAALVAALSVGGFGLTSATAANAEAATTYYPGRVTTEVLNVREYPTTASDVTRRRTEGQSLSIVCQVGVTIAQSANWYALKNGGYVTDNYVKLLGRTPRDCSDARLHNGTVTARPSLTIRTRPTSASQSAGRLPTGARVDIICKVNGQSVDGNRRWYQTPQGDWVAARYVRNNDGIPPFCR